ncbi:MAG: hypothetical protein KKD63_14405 [Proteobacteria bacterium]|nr:hypothetical protein [Pseudomonadota bacterium]
MKLKKVKRENKAAFSSGGGGFFMTWVIFKRRQIGTPIGTPSKKGNKKRATDRL